MGILFFAKTLKCSRSIDRKRILMYYKNQNKVLKMICTSIIWFESNEVVPTKPEQALFK